MLRFALYASLILPLMLVSGCGSSAVKKTTLTGTVSCNGQKLTQGLLRLVSANGDFVAASIQQNGTYIVTDIPPGQVKVGYRPTSSADSSKTQGGPPATAPLEVPVQFHDPETSGVVYTVAEGQTTLDIDFK